MKSKRQFSYLLIIAAVISLLAATQWVFAQTDTNTSLRIVGRVEAITDGSLLVNGRAISTANATVNTELAVGATVMIDGFLTADGQVEATDVESASADFLLPDELRITGVLKSSSASSFNLGGSLVESPDASLNSSLDAGSVVRVFADAENGDWSARRVQVLDRTSADRSANTDLSADLDLLSQGSYQIVGTLDSMDTNRIIISGVPIDTANADIKSNLVTGALVNVWLINTFAGFSASEVSNATFDADADTGVFLDVDANSTTSTDTNPDTSTSTDANLDADASASVGAEVGSASTDASAGVNIDLGGGVSIGLGG